MTVMAAGQDLLISLVVPLGRSLGLTVGAVVDERADRDLLHQLRHATGVVRMKMRQQHIVDLAHAGVFGRCRNALGIKTIVARPTRYRSAATSLPGLQRASIARRPRR